MRGERVFVAVLTLVSAAALWESYGIAGFSKWSSPGVFPMLASMTMLISALVIFFSTRSQVRNPARQDDAADTLAGTSTDISTDTSTDTAADTAADTSTDTSTAADTVIEDSATTSDLNSDLHRVLPRRVIVITVVLTLYVVAMPTLGFLLSSGLFLFFSIAYLWRKSVWLSLLLSLSCLLVVHLLFREVFQVILPEGTLIRLLSQ